MRVFLGYCGVICFLLGAMLVGSNAYAAPTSSAQPQSQPNVNLSSYIPVNFNPFVYGLSPFTAIP